MARLGMKKALFITICLLMALAGCEQPSAQLELQFEPDNIDTYQVMTKVEKKYEFIQPALGKEDIKNAGTTMDMTFDQEVVKVDEAGNATAKITIQEVQYVVTSRSGVEFEFDSSDSKFGSDPMMGLIGQSYTIVISPDGTGRLSTAQGAINAVQGQEARRRAGQLLSTRAVELRHSINAIPPMDSRELKVGQSWMVEEKSPQGMLSEKQYEKVYTLKKIQDVGGRRVAMIDLDVDTGSAPVTGTGQMGVFQNMFDIVETYDGHFKMDADSGTPLEYAERIEATYTAVEPTNQPSNKGPDTLTMGYVKEVSMKMVN